ncbi:heterogeneous nuclear ribonucleoprotein K isoform X2 [Coccinella septempunctata]|nr:heterogeneous nuclear ribonucleoprotein K isoform X2 [Coccinella septempunctata]XP_044744312.1 heterogeneous nuclear ribonucleoprotein K isoform X2 [Coccinella septempunctata]
MKREADGDMGSPQKRTRRGDEEVRLLIPSKVAGSIIGKGGSNITKLRSQYKASITVPDCPGPERILTLSSDLDTICNIINDVVPNLEEHSGSSSKELDLRMLIHRSQAGCVIGKSGQKIKEIREQTGARVKIFSNAAPQSTDRIIQIQGHPDKCIDTVREVITLIKGSPIKGAVNNYDPHNYDDFYADEYGGWGGNQNGGNDRRGGGGGGGSGGGGGGSFGGSGRGGGGGGRSSDMRGGGPSRMSSNRGPPPRGGRFNERSSSGGRDSFGGRGRQSLNGSGSFRSSDIWESPLNAPMNRPPPGGGMLGGSPIHNGLGSGISGGKNSTQVTIPKDLAGAIIGKGGGRIRKIRQDSGAGITIDEPLPGSNDRIITITGSQNQIQMAQYLLQQSVHNNAQDRGNY